MIVSAMPDPRIELLRQSGNLGFCKPKVTTCTLSTSACLHTNLQPSGCCRAARRKRFCIYASCALVVAIRRCDTPRLIRHPPTERVWSALGVLARSFSFPNHCCALVHAVVPNCAIQALRPCAIHDDYLNHRRSLCRNRSGVPRGLERGGAPGRQGRLFIHIARRYVRSAEGASRSGRELLRCHPEAGEGLI
jgi:hypothetical protein